MCYKKDYYKVNKLICKVFMEVIFYLELSLIKFSNFKSEFANSAILPLEGDFCYPG